MLGRPWIIFNDEYSGSSLSPSSISEGVEEPSDVADDARGISGIAQVGPVMYTAGSTTSSVDCAAASASDSVLEIQRRWSAFACVRMTNRKEERWGLA